MTSSGRVLPEEFRAPRQTAVGGEPRRLRTIMGEKIGPADKPDQQRDWVELPVWFGYDGIRSFTVDTGFGLVKCRVPGAKAQEAVSKAKDLLADAQEAYDRAKDGAEPARVAAKAAVTAATQVSEDAFVRWLVAAMVQVPDDWTASDDAPGLGLQAGARVPQPSTVWSRPADVCREYIGLLPPTLVSQISIAVQMIENFPPIVYEMKAVGPS